MFAAYRNHPQYQRSAEMFPAAGKLLASVYCLSEQPIAEHRKSKTARLRTRAAWAIPLAIQYPAEDVGACLEGWGG